MARSSGRTWMVTAGAFALLAATVGVVVWTAARDGGSDGGPASVAAPHERSVIQDGIVARPDGVITYSVTGKGFFRATAAGELLGPVATEDALHIHDAAPEGRVLSPDGSKSVVIQRQPEGVFLAVGAPGAEQVVTQLAGPSDPALVDGGKGHAREVEGIPLVVAWSPDSQYLAFGSITGEPWTLQLLDTRFSTQAAIRYFEVSGGYVGELAWASTGDHLAISTYSLDRRDHSVLMLELATTRVTREVDGCHLTWSPDGKHLAIHRDPGPEGGAWVVSPDGAVMYAISREQEAFPHSWTV